MLLYALLCRESLEFAERYLAGFDAPRALVTGNHDLEGEDFDTDEANLAAWRQVGLGFLWFVCSGLPANFAMASLSSTSSSWRPCWLCAGARLRVRAVGVEMTAC